MLLDQPARATGSLSVCRGVNANDGRVGVAVLFLRVSVEALDAFNADDLPRQRIILHQLIAFHFQKLPLITPCLRLKCYKVRQYSSQLGVKCSDLKAMIVFRSIVEMLSWVPSFPVLLCLRQVTRGFRNLSIARQ